MSGLLNAPEEAVFVLLEHAPGFPGEPMHWDFMLALPDREPLATWRLFRNPLMDPGPLEAQRLGDHRRIYLDYEGPLSGGRGVVRRLDRGLARIWRSYHDESILLELSGEFLRITAELTGGHWRRITGP